MAPSTGAAGPPRDDRETTRPAGKPWDDALVERVKAFLQASAAQEDAADEALADEVDMIFPIGRFRSLAALRRASIAHYRHVAKTFLTWDVAHHGNGTVVVVSTGTLSGENRHGVTFEGIRYIDRFTLRDGLIIRHEVWNDLAISGVLDRVTDD